MGADGYKNGFNSELHAFLPAQPIVEEAQEEQEESSNSKLEMIKEVSKEYENEKVCEPAPVAEDGDKCLIF